MTLNNISFYYSSPIYILTFLSSCSPALPGSIPAPKDFQEYSIRSENALLESQKQRKEVEKLLIESRELLSEINEIKAQIDRKHDDCKKTLSESKLKLKAAETERRRAQSFLAQTKAEKAKIAEVPTPAPSPSIPSHSSSDAP